MAAPCRPLRPTVVGLALALLTAVGCGERSIAPEEAPQSAFRPEFDISGSFEVGDDPYEYSPAVYGELVAHVAPGWTADQIDAVWGTITLAEIPGTPYALLYYGDEDYEELAETLVASGACTICERNYILQSPEAHQGSIAFYEATLTDGDMEAQPAFERVRVGTPLVEETGDGVVVAVLDTGVQFSHPALAGVLSPNGWDFIGNDSDPSETADGVDQDGDTLVDEAAGHGTHVAGVVNAVAPNATILPVRVLDDEGNGTIFGLARGLRYALQQGADIVQMSLGFEGRSPMLARLVGNAYAQGRLLVASVGNDGRPVTAELPAGYPSVVAVASVDLDDQKSDFSNWGSLVTLCAPGEGIVSTYLFDGYAVWSGTSMAAPFVSGAAALILEKGSMHPLEVRQALLDGAVALDHSGQPWQGYLGEGRVDIGGLSGPGEADGAR